MSVARHSRGVWPPLTRSALSFNSVISLSLSLFLPASFVRTHGRRPFFIPDRTSHPCFHLNKPRDVASGQNPRSCTSSPKLPTASFSRFSHDRSQLISPSLPLSSLSLTTLYHANRRSPPLLRLDIRLHEGAIVVDDRREISSPPSRGTSRPLVTDEGAKTCPVAERGTRMASRGCGAESRKRHLLPPALPRVSLRGGLTPCVGATRIPSSSEERRLR